MKKLLVLITAVISCSSAIFAAPVDSKIIPAEAQAVLHLDFDAFRGSQYLEMINELQESEEDPMAEVIEMLGFDPVKEMLSLTLYADSFDQNMAGILIAQTKNDVLQENQLIETIKEENQEIKIASSSQSGNKIYTIDGSADGKKAQLCFLNQKTAMIGLNNEDLASAIKTCKSKSGSYSSMATVPAGSILSINLTGLDLTEAASTNPQAQMLKDVNGMSCFIGETDGGTFITAKLSVKDDTAATMLQAQLSGMLQFASMSVVGMAPEMMPHMQNIKVLADGSAVNVTFNCPSETIMGAVQTVMAAQAAVPEAMEGHEHHDHGHNHGSKENGSPASKKK